MTKTAAALVGLATGLAIGAVAVAVSLNSIPEPPQPDRSCAQAVGELDALLEATASDLLVPTSERVYADETVDPQWFADAVAELAERQQTIDMSTLRECLNSTRG